MVERTNPRLGEIIFDPACGTGGFLTSALEHIRKHEVKSPADGTGQGPGRPGIPPTTSLGFPSSIPSRDLDLEAAGE